MALSLMFSANAAAEMLARQCGAVGIVTYDLPPYTQTTDVKVPYEWLLANWPDAVDEYEAYEAAAKATAANGRKVWECFMLGVDPTKADDDFRITHFWMENGEPKFEFSHSADGSGNSFMLASNRSARRNFQIHGRMYRPAAIRHSGSLRWKWHCRKAVGE